MSDIKRYAHAISDAFHTVMWVIKTKQAVVASAARASRQAVEALVWWLVAMIRGKDTGPQ